MTNPSDPASDGTFLTPISSAIFSAPNGVTSGLITPSSSAGPLPGTQTKESGNESGVSGTTIEIRQELIQKLETLAAVEKNKPPRTQPPTDTSIGASSSSSKGLPEFKCAFGWDGTIYEPEPVPETKDAFLVALRGEIEGIPGVQRGLQSYQTAINSREYHTFGTEFLIDQNTAVIITVDQLDQIIAHLEKVEKKVQSIEGENEKLKEELMNAFKQAQPWVMRSRAILRHCHVFYKINFVLAFPKKSEPAQH